VLLCGVGAAVALASCVAVEQGLDSSADAGVLPDESVPTFASSLERVESYLRFGDADAALAAYQAALQRQPEAAATQILLARLYLLAGDERSAEAQLVAMLRDPSLLTGDEQADAHYALSLVAASRGDPAAQREHLRDALRGNPRHGDALASLAARDASDGDADSARSLYTRALQAQPENVAALLGLGALATAGDQHEEAIRYYDEARAVAPNHPFVYVDRAAVLREQSKYDEAIADMSRAIELEPEFYWHFLDRGRLYALSGEPQPAAADFGRAIELEPESFVAYVNRGNLAYRGRRLLPALRDYDAAIALRPDYYPAYPYLGLLHAADGDWERAGTFFAQAAERDPSEPGYSLLAGLSERFSGGNAADNEWLGRIRTAARRDMWYYDIARLILEEVDTLTLNTKYRGHRERTIGARVMFYLGAVELLAGHQATAQVYFLDAGQLTEADYLERNLAHFLADADAG
jgi:tetratricopeptide (TPR) repeat protein